MNAPPLSFGRGAENSVSVLEKTISERHCTVHCKPSMEIMGAADVVITDNSHNGTFVCGARLQKGESRTLRHCDEISLGVSSADKDKKSAPRLICVFVFVQPFHMPPLFIPPSVSPPVSCMSDLEHEVRSKYALCAEVGSGNFSRVFIAIDRASGEKYAAKRVNVKTFANFSRKCGTSSLTLSSEFDMLKRCCGEGVVNLIEVYKDERPDGTFGSNYIWIITELLEGGDLLTKLLREGPCSEDEARRIFTDVLSGLHQLHSQQVAHRDIKPENILLTLDHRAKISDFGLARYVKVGENNLKRCTTVCGTPAYFAPELVSYMRSHANSGKAGDEVISTGNTTGYDEAVDCWALGVVLYILIAARPPFEDRNIYDNIASGKFQFDCPEFVHVSSEAKELIRMLMTVDTENRLTAAEARNHPWVKGICSGSRRRNHFSGQHAKSQEPGKRRKLVSAT